MMKIFRGLKINTAAIRTLHHHHNEMPVFCEPPLNRNLLDFKNIVPRVAQERDHRNFDDARALFDAMSKPDLTLKKLRLGQHHQPTKHTFSLFNQNDSKVHYVSNDEPNPNFHNEFTPHVNL